MPQILRPYQLEAVAALRAEIKRGRKRIVLVSPTGSGKTTIAAHMIEAAVAKGKRIAFLAHRKELIDQASARLDDLGIDHGIIKADHPRRRPWLNVQVASVPTLVKRLGKLAQPDRKQMALEALAERPGTETEGAVARDMLARYSSARGQFTPDLIFVDEAHRSRAASYHTVLAAYPGAVVIGLTATPIRADGRGLAQPGEDGTPLFEAMVECPSIAELTAMGHLVPVRVYAPSKPDLDAVKVTAGDYNQEQLSLVMDKAVLIGDIVHHWLELAKLSVGAETDEGQRFEHVQDKTPSGDGRPGLDGRRITGPYQVALEQETISTGRGTSCGDVAKRNSPTPEQPNPRRPTTYRRTVVFATSIDHSKHIVAQFREAGIPAEHLDGTMGDAEREGKLAMLARGEIDVLSNVGVLTEGWDLPSASCAVMARPTKSLGLYLQMAGRILRPAQGKTDALILDHAGLVHAHGFVDEPRDWSLDPDRKSKEVKKKCKACGRTGYGRRCTFCGGDMIIARTVGIWVCDMCYAAVSNDVKVCPACKHVHTVQGRNVETVDGKLVEHQSPARVVECRECASRSSHNGYTCAICGGRMVIPKREPVGDLAAARAEQKAWLAR